MRLTSLLVLAGGPVLAQIVFTDSNMSLGSYTQSQEYITAGSSLSISNAGGGLEVVVNATGTGSNVRQGAVAFANNSFTYNPGTQGPLQSLSFTETTNYSNSVSISIGTPWTTGCVPMIEQDGKYYVALIPGPTYYSGSSGFFTCSQSGMTAADFAPFDFSAGGLDSGNPNFSGDPMTFGTLFSVYAYQNALLTQVVGSLSFSLVTASTPAVLTASPSTLTFTASTGSYGPALEQTISVANSGGASANITASAEFDSPWVSVSPASGVAAPGSSLLFTVTVNPQGLSPGGYRDVIQFLGTNAAAAAPLSLLVANPNPVVFAGPRGFLFTMIQGAGSSVQQNLAIANQGNSGSSVNWTVAAATGPGIPDGNFLSFGSANGQTQAGAASSVSISLNSNASTLVPGVYYELIQVSAPGVQNSPQYSTAVLDVLPATGTIQPEVSPAGLLFTGSAGATVVPQQFAVNWSSTAEQVIVPAASTANGQNWLAVSPASAVVTSTSPGVFSVSVNTASLAAGVYTGTVQLNGGAFGALNVTLIITSGAQSYERAKVRELGSASTCTPSMVVLTETGIPTSFTVPAGWPADLIATMTDDCGNSVNNGAVAANFSDGDPPLALTAQGSAGQYLAVWQPSKATNAIITLTGSAPALASSSIQVKGFVTANRAPVLTPNGILNNLNPLVGAAVAPGTVAAAFGTGLTTAATPVSPNESPLPDAFQNTELIIGGSIAPLYFLSSTQLNVEIPVELPPLQQLTAVAVVNNALSLPVTVSTVAAAPGVAVNADGSVIAQDSNFNLIDAANPAHPGEAIVIYLVGMGATDPPVASGQPAPGLNPGDSLAQAVVQPVVMVNNQTAQVAFAGLTPGGIGLYQINFTVPSGIAAGTASLTISQGSVNANSATLPVAVP